MAAAVARRERRYRTGRTAYGPDLTAYDGSAARVLEREEVLQPRPRVRPRERAVARPKVRVREAGQVSLFAVVGFLAVGVFAALVLMSNVKLAALSSQMTSLSDELSELQSEEAKLRAEYELSVDLAALEQSLTESGTMVKPQSGQVIYLDLSEPDRVELFQEENTADGLNSALESVKQVFENVVEYFR